MTKNRKRLDSIDMAEVINFLNTANSGGGLKHLKFSQVIALIKRETGHIVSAATMSRLSTRLELDYRRTGAGEKNEAPITADTHRITALQNQLHDVHNDIAAAFGRMGDDMNELNRKMDTLINEWIGCADKK